MPISEDNGDGSRAYMKPQFRGAGRYQQRDVYDTNMREAGELWQANAQADHPMRQMKGTIAQLSATPYQIAKNSVPNSTFKGGIAPRTFEVLSLEDDWDHAEATSQASEAPRLTRYEQAGLMRMKHMLPAKYRAAVQDKESLVISGEKYRTNYAKPQKPAKFNDGRRTYTDLHQSTTALQNYRGNRGIAGAPTLQEFKEAEFTAARARGIGKHASQETIMNAIKTARTLFMQGPVAALKAPATQQGFETFLKTQGFSDEAEQKFGATTAEMINLLKAGAFGF